MDGWWKWLLNIGVYSILAFLYLKQSDNVIQLKKDLHLSNFNYSNLKLEHITLKRRMEKMLMMYVKYADENSYLLIDEKAKNFSMVDKDDFDYIVPSLGYYSPNVQAEAKELEGQGYTRKELW